KSLLAEVELEERPDRPQGHVAGSKPPSRLVQISGLERRVMVDLTQEDADVRQRAVLEKLFHPADRACDRHGLVHQAGPAPAITTEKPQREVLLRSRKAERPAQDLALDRHAEADAGVRGIGEPPANLG